MFYPTAFSDWGDSEYEAIQRVLESGRFTMGEEVEAFEAEFAAFHKMKHGIMVNSGSSANLIMVQALVQGSRKDYSWQFKPGTTVLVPALAWSTTYAPFVQAGFELKLMDCDASWCFRDVPNPLSFVAVGVSILGVPAVNTAALKDRVAEYGGVLLEDNCEALGAHYPGDKLCGTLGLMNSFSFYYSHQISAVEGGMILTNDDECARLCRILRGHGWTRDVDPPTRFEDEYNFTHFGFNVRPLEMHAAVARVQLKRLPGFIDKRRQNLKYFHEQTKGLPIEHQNAHGLRTSPFGLAFTVDLNKTRVWTGPGESAEARSRLVSALRRNGVDCRLPTGGSFARHPYGKPWEGQFTPNADRIHDTGLFLGNAPFLIYDKIDCAVRVLREVLT